MYSIYYLYEASLQSVNAQMRMYQADLDDFLERTSPNDIYWSPKIDGVRCWAVIDKRTIPEKSGFRKIGNVTYLSRNDKYFPNFDKFDNAMIEMAHVINREHRIKYPIIIDAEVSSRDRSLSSVMTQLRRIKSMNPETFVLNAFDLAVSSLPFKKRYDIIQDAVKKVDTDDVKLIPYEKLRDTSKDNLYRLRDQMIKKYDYEGIMLIDGSSEYDFNKRSRSCVKLKEANTVDLEVVDIKIGDPGTRWEGVVSALICNFEDKKISVSGRMSKDQRSEWAKSPSKIIGKKVEISYQNITRHGVLRHPIFIRVREDK